jgi:hypothetical protein
VLFVVFGLAAIWIGAWRRWRWVRNIRFRVIHLLAIGLVAAESILGVDCPMTVWENRLRGEGDSGFLQLWLHRLMFFDAPSWVFTSAYLLFAAAVAASWFVIRPARRVESGL